MRTLDDIRNEFLVRMNQSTTVAFYTDTIIANWISQAHRWAASRYKWSMTEGRVSTTFASLTTNEDGYTTLEYPEAFRTDSIRLLTIGGSRFDKKNFYKFQSFIEDQSSDTSKIYTDFNRRVFINPRAEGLSGTVVAWGQYNVGKIDITDNTATTIFSDVEDDGNEAILQEVIGLAMQREKKEQSYLFHHNNALTILKEIFERQKGEQAMYQDTDNDGIYKRFDVVNGGLSDEIFNRDQF